MTDRPPWTPPVYNPKTGIVRFSTNPRDPPFRAQIIAYYEQFRGDQMKHFAEFVLEQGYGATTPKGIRLATGEMAPETWQACGKRLFGDRFLPVMARAIEAYKATQRGGAPPPAAAAAEPPAYVTERIPDPDF